MSRSPPSSRTSATPSAIRQATSCSQPRSRRRASDRGRRRDPSKTKQGVIVQNPIPLDIDVRPHHEPTGILRWITSTNHKDIGTLYLVFSFAMFLVGGLMAMAIRAELFQPGLQILRPEVFNEFTTLHGLIMVFAALMPAFVGLANWQLPMMLGAA